MLTTFTLGPPDKSQLMWLTSTSVFSKTPKICTSSLPQVFFEDHPVDFLLRWFVALSGLDHTKGNLRKPTLFQHHGLYSSLKGKQQPLKV